MGMLEIKRWLTLKFAEHVIPPTIEERWKWLPTKNMFDPVWEGAFMPGGGIKDTAKVLSVIEEPVPYAYTVPLLSSHYCDWLIEQADNRDKWGHDKGDRYGAWEQDLGRLKYGIDAYHRKVIIGDVLSPLFDGIYQWIPKKIDRIFLIKYETSRFPEMKSHWDEQSILSVSINLNDPAEYDGGELTFIRTPEVEIRGAKGHALMFAGSPVMSHQTHPVTEGVRYVLVYWLI